MSTCFPQCFFFFFYADFTCEKKHVGVLKEVLSSGKVTSVARKVLTVSRFRSAVKTQLHVVILFPTTRINSN